ncbi:adenosylcobinamide-GDP ribazoletransferase [Primorskyibacter sp. S87]|uniref:adenosylcobinamide-GDP ribazoletransferase n=1 Tax=Primorskyibacter sp. S87 TaxID=3415126 RepID=UPI003C7EC430
MTKSDMSPVSPLDPLLALVLLTRLPLPRLPDRLFARQALAAWAYPLAGLVVALLAIAVGAAGLAMGLPAPAVAGLILAVLVISTGAMHEDGLADTADGFWGGFDRDRRLAIMKDSQIGTYGVLALILSQGLRWTALAGLVAAGALWPVVGAACLSRGVLPFMMRALPNARGSGLSHKVGSPGWGTAIFALGLGICLFLLSGGGLLHILPAALALVVVAVVAYRKIGGQTGDILGATQQVTEITLLLALAA